MTKITKTKVRLKSLRKLRLAKKLTQKQLAELLGISVRQVSRYETTGCYPRGPLLERLCEVLGCQETQLIRAAKVA